MSLATTTTPNPIETTQELHSKTIINYNDEAHSLEEVKLFCMKTFDWDIKASLSRPNIQEEMGILPNLLLGEELDTSHRMETKLPFLDDIMFKLKWRGNCASFECWWEQLVNCLKGFENSNDNLRLECVDIQLFTTHPLIPITLATLEPSIWPDTVNVKHLHRKVDLVKCDVRVPDLPDFLQACIGSFLYEHFFGNDPSFAAFEPRTRTLESILRFVCWPLNVRRTKRRLDFTELGCTSKKLKLVHTE